MIHDIRPTLDPGRRAGRRAAPARPPGIIRELGGLLVTGLRLLIPRPTGEHAGPGDPVAAHADSAGPQAALSERIRVLVLAQVLLLALLLVVNLVAQNGAWPWMTSALATPILLAGGGLYLLRRTRYAEGAVYADLTLIALLLAAADPLSGTLSGMTWVLFQIWSPLVALTVRKPRAAAVSAAIPLGLLLLSALIQITGLVPVALLLPPEKLLRHLGYQAVILIVLAVALHWLSASEQRAWRVAHAAQDQIEQELARARALAAEIAQLNTTLEGRVAARNAVAEQRAAALAASEERYALAARAANDGLWDWNFAAQQVFFSPRWKAMLGYAETEIGTTPAEWYNRIHRDDRAQVLARLSALIQNPIDQIEVEYRIAHRDGTYRWMLCRGLVMRDRANRLTRLVGSQTDITDRKLAEARLRYNALHDSLTGLPNRALFVDRLGQAIRRGRGAETPGFALLLLDLDRFKTVNDSLGHQAGDELLIAVARRLEGCLHPGDTVARLSGDEFTMLLEPPAGIPAGPGGIAARAEQIQQALAPPFPVQGQDIFTTASMGIVLGTCGYVHPDDMLRDADAALHQAKLLGKGRHAVFDAPMYCQALSRLQLETDLHRALERDEFRLHYQPIAVLANTLVVGFEALVRWQHPTRGLLAPGEFLPLAEDTGLITPLSYWVLDAACRRLAAWQRDLAPLPLLTMSVNMPARLLTQPELLPRIMQTLQETGLAARQLKLELLEHTLVAEGDAAAAALRRLKALGVQLSIDDFGTGYSSLSYLHRFPVDTIKIDRSFISRLGTDREHAEIIAAIVTLARSLGMGTVAEGVETPEQRLQLQALGCDYGQGWLFARPLPPAQATELVATLRLAVPGRRTTSE